MICPKCGRPVKRTAVICSSCDFILDTSFLGEEILDEEKTLRPGAGGIDPEKFNLADAVILGDIGADAGVAFETADTGFNVKETTGARLYVSGQSKAMLAPDAIPAIKSDSLADVRLTPFEKHVLSFIDGERPVETIRSIAGLDDAEVKTALATLADKGVVEVIGRALVDLQGLDVKAAPRRKQAARLPSGLVPIGSPQDDTDMHLDAAFQTQAGIDIRSLSGEASVEGLSTEQPGVDPHDNENPAYEEVSISAEGNIEPNILDGSQSESGAVTLIRDNMVNAINAASRQGNPSDAEERAENEDEFEGPTRMVAAYQKGSSNRDSMMAGISQFEDGPATAAIQQIANSQLGGEVIGEAPSGTHKLPASPTGRKEIGYSSLFGDEPEAPAPKRVKTESLDSPKEAGERVVHSSDETPSFRGGAARLEDNNGMNAPTRQFSLPDASQLSDFSGDEYSDEMGVSMEGIADDFSEDSFLEHTNQRGPARRGLTFSSSQLDSSASEDPYGAIPPDAEENSVRTATKPAKNQVVRSRPATQPVAVHDGLPGGSSMASFEYIDDDQIVGTRRLAPLSRDVEAMSEDGTSQHIDENSPPAKQAEQLYAEALKDRENGRLARARMNARLANVLDPSNDVYSRALIAWAPPEAASNDDAQEVVLYERAQELEASDPDQAIELLQQGIALNPSVAAFHNRLGVVLALKKQDFQEAARCVRRAVRLEPENMHYKNNLGKIEKKAAISAPQRVARS